MTIDKEYIKNKNFWVGLIVLLVGFFPEAKEIVTQNFDVLNTVMGVLLGLFGIADAKKTIELKK